MKRNFLYKTTLLIPLALTLFSVIVFAAECKVGDGTGCIPNITFFDNPAQLVGRALQLIQPVAIIGFVFSVVYAGFLKMSAGVNADGDKKAMTIAKAAITGFIIIFMASFITNIIMNLLGVKI